MGMVHTKYFSYCGPFMFKVQLHNMVLRSPLFLNQMSSLTHKFYNTNDASESDIMSTVLK